MRFSLLPALLAATALCGTSQGFALSLTDGRASSPAVTAAPTSQSVPLRVINFRGGELVRYPLVLLRGTGENGQVTIENSSNSRPDGKNHSSIKSHRFRLLVELVPGTNHVVVTAGDQHVNLDLRYQPACADYHVNFIYLTAEDGNTAYLTQRENDPQNYREKLDTAAKLIQSFTAESINDLGWGRWTFNLDFDSAGKVKVLTLHYPDSVEHLRSLDGHKLYDLIYAWLEKKLPFNSTRNVVVMGFSGYDPATKKPLAHIAWGGRAMGLFSSLSMAAWPDNIRDVERAFSDTTPIDETKTYNDCMPRGRMWALGATGIGVIAHELGHTFVGAEHSRDRWSVMSAGTGWGDLHRAFVPVDAPHRLEKEEVAFKDTEVPHWDPYNASLLVSLRYFQPNPRTYRNDRSPRIIFDADRDEVQAVAPNGIRLIHCWKQTDPPSNTLFQFYENAPRVVRIKRSALRQMVQAPEGAAVHVTDTQGLVYSLNEGNAFKNPGDLPPLTDAAYLAFLRDIVSRNP